MDDDFKYVPEEIERPEKFKTYVEEKESEEEESLTETLNPIEFNTGPITREMLEELRKQIADWPITPNRIIMP